MTPRSRAFWGLPLVVWIVLMILLGATYLFSYVPMRRWHPVANLAVSAVMMSLVGIFFMHLRNARPLVRLAAVASFFWLAVEFALTFSDYLSRG